MTKEKLKSVFRMYAEHIKKCNDPVYAHQMDEQHSKYRCNTISPRTRVAHLIFMCEEAERFVDAGRIEKAMRWLGFLQGALWADDQFSLDDLKNHSRPDEKV